MTGMLLSSGIPRWLIVRVSWISPPSTSVWLFKSTTDVSASRLRKDGEFVGATAGPTELTSCLTSSATVPRSPMRGVTILDRLVDAARGDARARGAARRAGRAHRAGLLARDDRDRLRHIDDGLLVLRRHDVRVADDVDAIVRGEGVEHSEELVGRERESGEPAGGQAGDGGEGADRI